MAIITTTTIAITAKVIFISFGLAAFFNQFTRSPFSKFQKIILQWVSVLFITRYPHRIQLAVEILG